MSVQMVIMLSTLLIFPLLPGVLTLVHVRNDRRTPSRARRATLSIHEYTCMSTNERAPHV